jgi:ADP-ribosylglycohydrolase
MEKDYLMDRVLGGIFGQAFGDAFAMPSMLRPEVTKSRYGRIIDFLDAPDDHPAHHGLKAGRITDDTEQALSLALIIIEHGKITVEGASKAIINWYDLIDGDNNDYVGPSTRKAVAKLKKGADPLTTGTQGDTDGGAMRISPIGLINPGNIEKAVFDTSIACTPTHNTDVAISGAAAIAGAISYAMTPNSTFEGIIKAGKDASILGLNYGAPWMGASIAKRIDLALQLVNQDKEVYECLVDVYDLVGCGLLTSEAVPAAFGVFYLAKGDIIKCAEYAAMLSGDADTVGAMACAIAGSWKGFSLIPDRFVKKLEEVNKPWNFKQIAEGITSIAIAQKNS